MLTQATPNDSEQLRTSFSGSDEGMQTRRSSISSISASPNIPSSGAQTPALCRPLLRRRSSSHASKLRHVSEETVPQLQDSLRKAQGWLSGTTTFTPRYRANSTTSITDDQSCRENNKPRALHSDSRPSGPRRRFSSEVHERELSLRSELEELRTQVRDQEERKQEEMRMVEFAINRITETQMNHIRVQQVLLDKVAALDLQTKETKLEMRKAKEESKRCARGEVCCMVDGGK